MSDTLTRIDKMVKENAVMLFMKGTPQFPMCGFSSRTLDALKKVNRPFAWCNVIVDQDVRAALPKYQDWPTFPQLYVKGELIGGCDIVLELFESGQLQPMIEQAVDEF